MAAATEDWTARLLVLSGAALFSTAGAAIKLTGLSGLQVAGLRSGVAALAVLLFLRGARSRGTWRTWLVGLSYAATMLLFVQANKLTTAASTIFLQATAPLYLLALGPLLLRERLRRVDLLFLPAAAVGLGLLVLGAGAPRVTAPRPLLGNVLASFSGATLALTYTGMRWLAREEDGKRGTAASAVLAGNVIAFLACLPWSLQATGASAWDWLVVGYLGAFQVGLGYALLAVGLRRVPAMEASLLMMLEPVLNPLWAFLVHGESPGALALAGGAVVLAATTLRTLWDPRAVRDSAARDAGAAPVAAGGERPSAGPASACPEGRGASARP